ANRLSRPAHEKSISDKGPHLLQQNGMPLDARQSGAFATATIEKVVLHKGSKLWEFTYRLETPLRLMDYQLYKARLATEV
ncbi:PolC-type DNA polymerase III N-terminal domain-containing protein, partial [Streptococcus suis]